MQSPWRLVTGVLAPRYSPIPTTLYHVWWCLCAKLVRLPAPLGHTVPLVSKFTRCNRKESGKPPPHNARVTNEQKKWALVRWNRARNKMSYYSIYYTKGKRKCDGGRFLEIGTTYIIISTKKGKGIFARIEPLFFRFHCKRFTRTKKLNYFPFLQLFRFENLFLAS